jgi:hypothetical protein
LAQVDFKYVLALKGVAVRNLRISNTLLLITICLGIAGSVQAGVVLNVLDVTDDQAEDQIHWGDLAVDDSDQVHLIWVSPKPSESRPGKLDHHLFYRIVNARDSARSAAVDLSQSGYRVEGLPAIACNDRGQTAIVAYVYDSVNQVNSSLLWTLKANELVPDTIVQLGAGAKVRGRCGLADVAVAKDGRIIAAYETPDIADSVGELATTIWFEIFDSHGRSLSPATVVGSGRYSYARATNPHIAINGAGAFAIAWNARLLENKNFFPEQVFTRIYDSTGAPATEEMLISCEGPPGYCQGDTSIFRAGPAGKFPAVAISEAGAVAIAFRNTRYFECSNEYFVLRLFGPDGAPIGSMQKINTVTECGASSFSAALAFAPDDRLLVTWTNNNAGESGTQTNRAYYQWYDKNGLRIDDNQLLDSPRANSNTGCDWRTACAISRRGLMAISTVCTLQEQSRRKLQLFLTRLPGLDATH